MKSSHMEPANYRRNRQHLVKSPPSPTQLETAEASVPDPLPEPELNADTKLLKSSLLSLPNCGKDVTILVQP